MGYVNRNLMPGERVVYNATIHWFIFMPALITFLIAIVLLGLDRGFGLALSALAALLALFYFLRALTTKISTELAVTSKRVIAKVGLIRRHSIELNHSKVESFHVDQSILGRIFGFGTVIIHGTGGGTTPIPNIAAPLAFRRNAMETIDASQSTGPS